MNTKKQLIAFVLVGGLNTLVGYAWYALFIFYKMSYPMALLLATILGIVFNFKTMGTFVFKNSNNALLFKFIGVYLFLYGFNITMIGLFKHISPDLYVAGFLAIIPSAALGFLLNKHLVFKKAYSS